MGLRRKERLHEWRSSLGSEQFETLTGHPRPGSDPVGSLHSTPEELIHACLFLSKGREGWWSAVCSVLKDCPSVHPSLSWEDAPASLISWHSSTLAWGMLWPRREFTVGHRGGSDPICFWAVWEQPSLTPRQSAHQRQTKSVSMSGLPKPPPWPTPRAHTGPPCPLERQKTRAREHSPSGEFSCRTKEAWRSEAASDQDTGNHYYYLHRQHIRSNLFSDPGWTTTSHSPNHAEFSHQPLLLKHCYPLGQGCQCWKGRELHLKWMEPAQTWSSGLLLLLFGTLLHS